MLESEPCRFLDWDTSFFGYRIARVTRARVDVEQARAILAWCQLHRIECLYFLAESGDRETIKVVEDHGFRLVDIRVTLDRSLRDWPERFEPDPASRVHIRQSRLADVPALEDIARASHGDSRFYFDEHFGRSSAAALYAIWIRQSCEGSAGAVYVAEVGGQLVGYVSCNLVPAQRTGQIGLLGVAGAAQGRGVGQALVHRALEWFADHDAETVAVVTQGRNTAAQRLYQRCGFVTRSVQLWYHRWTLDSTPTQA